MVVAAVVAMAAGKVAPPSLVSVVQMRPGEGDGSLRFGRSGGWARRRGPARGVSCRVFAVCTCVCLTCSGRRRVGVGRWITSAAARTTTR